MGENEVQDAPLDLREQLASALADASFCLCDSAIK